MYPLNENKRQPVKGHVRVIMHDSSPSNGTVDLTSEETALRAFFEPASNDTSAFNISSTDYPEDGIDFLTYNGELSKRDLEKRDVFSWIESGVNWFVKVDVRSYRKLIYTRLT